MQAWLGKFEAGLTGVSGPYVQYAAVRVNKILLDKLTFKLWGGNASHVFTHGLNLLGIEVPGQM